MKSKVKTGIRKTPKPSLLVRVINPRYINLSGKYDPMINRAVKRIIAQSS